jgi:hypothetical protein
MKISYITINIYQNFYILCYIKMEFFEKFRKLYNFSKSLEESQQIYSYVNDTIWINFQKIIKDYNIENFEILYKVILNYHFLETKKLDDYPYKIKIYSDVEGGIVFEPKNLPVCLQYMLLYWY